MSSKALIDNRNQEVSCHLLELMKCAVLQLLRKVVSHELQSSAWRKHITFALFSSSILRHGQKGCHYSRSLHTLGADREECSIG